MSFKKYIEISKLSFVNATNYMGDVLGLSLFLSILFVVFILMWSAVYQENQVISGFTLNTILWYLVMSESIIATRTSLVKNIGESIQNGTVANHLNKPYNYILYKYFGAFGRSFFKFGIVFILGSIIMLISVGPLKMSIYAIPFVLFSAAIAVLLNLMISSFLGIFSFWFEDARSIEFIYDKLVFILGGMLLPLDMFPTWLNKISSVLPFSYIAYYPSKLFVDFSFHYFIKGAMFQIGWLVFFSIATFLLYKTFAKRLSVNGG